MKITQEKLKTIIEEETKQVLSKNNDPMSQRNAINEAVLNEISIRDELQAKQKDPKATTCDGASCPPDMLGYNHAHIVSRYTSQWFDYLMADVQKLWTPLCNGQESDYDGGFGGTDGKNLFRNMTPEAKKSFACEYKKAFADGLLAFRDFHAPYAAEDWRSERSVEYLENALKKVAGMVPPPSKPAEQNVSESKITKEELMRIIAEEAEAVYGETLDSVAFPQKKKPMKKCPEGHTISKETGDCEPDRRRPALREQTEDFSPGDFVEIRVSDDGYERSFEKVDPDEYDNVRGGAWGPSLKMLAKVLQVAELKDDWED